MGYKMNKEELMKFYEENMYGVRRSGETVSYELLGPDPAVNKKSPMPWNPFAVVGGDLVKINVEKDGRSTSFTVARTAGLRQFRSGCAALNRPR